jgi:hypothetical protein
VRNGKPTAVVRIDVGVADAGCHEDLHELEAAVPSLVASGLGLSRSLGWRPGIPIRTS